MKLLHWMIWNLSEKNSSFNEPVNTVHIALHKFEYITNNIQILNLYLNENTCFKCSASTIWNSWFEENVVYFLWTLNTRELSPDWLYLTYHVIVGGSSWSVEIMRMTRCSAADDSRWIPRAADVPVKRTRGGDRSPKQRINLSPGYASLYVNFLIYTLNVCNINKNFKPDVFELLWLVLVWYFICNYLIACFCYILINNEELPLETW